MKVRWMLGFWCETSDSSPSDERSFPKVAFWHDDQQACCDEGKRVLQELRQRGDLREWIAFGHPDPAAVFAGRSPGGQWMCRSRQLPP